MTLSSASNVTSSRFKDQAQIAFNQPLRAEWFFDFVRSCQLIVGKVCCCKGRERFELLCTAVSALPGPGTPLEIFIFNAAVSDLRSRTIQLNSAKPRSITPETACVERAVIAIETRFTDPLLSATDIAKYAGVSADYLSRLFTKTFGCGVRSYLRRVRAASAFKLVSQTPKSVKEIAFETGFSSQSQLDRAFVDEFGYPPTYFRRCWRSPP